MTTLSAGQKTSISIPAGKVATIIANAQGVGNIWFTKPGTQDVLGKALVAGNNVHIGPYGQVANVRVECSAGSIDLQTEFDAVPTPFEVARQMGVLIKTITAATYTLSDQDHGYMLLFAAGCTITLPPALRGDFSCGWSQESGSILTFAAGSGVTITSKAGVLATTTQYSVGGVASFAQNSFRLMGV